MPSKAPTPCGRCGRKAIRNGLCDIHARQREHQRGTTTERGYGTPHKQLRADWKTRIDRGEIVICAKPSCGKPITPGQPFDLGHDENRIHRGPEHQACNRATKRPTSAGGGFKGWPNAPSDP
jgi:hypothetical protein